MMKEEVDDKGQPIGRSRLFREARLNTILRQIQRDADEHEELLDDDKHPVNLESGDEGSLNLSHNDFCPSEHSPGEFFDESSIDDTASVESLSDQISAALPSDGKSSLRRRVNCPGTIKVTMTERSHQDHGFSPFECSAPRKRTKRTDGNTQKKRRATHPPSTPDQASVNVTAPNRLPAILGESMIPSRPQGISVASCIRNRRQNNIIGKPGQPLEMLFSQYGKGEIDLSTLRQTACFCEYLPQDALCMACSIDGTSRPGILSDLSIPVELFAWLNSLQKEPPRQYSSQKLANIEKAHYYIEQSLNFLFTLSVEPTFIRECPAISRFLQANSSTEKRRMLFRALTLPQSFWPCLAEAIGRPSSTGEWDTRWLESLPNRTEDVCGAYLITSLPGPSKRPSTTHCVGSASVAYGGSSVSVDGISNRLSQHKGTLKKGFEQIEKEYRSRHSKSTECLYVHQELARIGGSCHLQVIFAWPLISRLPPQFAQISLCVVALQETLVTALFDTILIEDPKAGNHSAWFTLRESSRIAYRRLQELQWRLGKPRGCWNGTNIAAPFMQLDITRLYRAFVAAVFIELCHEAADSSEDGFIGRHQLIEIQRKMWAARCYPSFNSICSFRNSLSKQRGSFKIPFDGQRRLAKTLMLQYVVKKHIAEHSLLAPGYSIRQLVFVDPDTTLLHLEFQSICERHNLRGNLGQGIGPSALRLLWLSLPCRIQSQEHWDSITEELVLGGATTNPRLPTSLENWTPPTYYQISRALEIKLLSLWQFREWHGQGSHICPHGRRMLNLSSKDLCELTDVVNAKLQEEELPVLCSPRSLYLTWESQSPVFLRKDMWHILAKFVSPPPEQERSGITCRYTRLSRKLPASVPEYQAFSPQHDNANFCRLQCQWSLGRDVQIANEVGSFPASPKSNKDFTPPRSPTINSTDGESSCSSHTGSDVSPQENLDSPFANAPNNDLILGAEVIGMAPLDSIFGEPDVSPKLLEMSTDTKWERCGRCTLPWFDNERGFCCHCATRLMNWGRILNCSVRGERGFCTECNRENRVMETTTICHGCHLKALPSNPKGNLPETFAVCDKCGLKWLSKNDETCWHCIVSDGSLVNPAQFSVYGQYSFCSSCKRENRYMKDTLHCLSCWRKIVENAERPSQLTIMMITPRLPPPDTPGARENDSIPWTVEDFVSIRKGVQSGKSVKSIAEALGRTTAPVQSKLTELNHEIDLRLNQRKRPDMGTACCRCRRLGKKCDRGRPCVFCRWAGAQCKTQDARTDGKKGWSTVEDERLILSKLAGLTFKEIGKAIGRTKRSVAGRWMEYLSVGGKAEKKRPLWSPEDEARLISGMRAGESMESLETALGRSSLAISRRRKKLQEKEV